MNCSICGTTLQDNAVFCSHCGHAVQPMQNQSPVYDQSYQTQPSMYGQGIEPPKKSKAPWIALGISIFLLIGIITTIIILLVSCSDADNSSPDAVVQSYFDALSDDDADTLLDTIYPSIVAEYTGMGLSDESLFYTIKADTLEDITDTKVSFSNFEITSRDEVEADVISEGNEEMCEMEDYIPMSSGVYLYGTITATVAGVSDPLELEWSALVVCADDDYYIVDFILYD